MYLPVVTILSDGKRLDPSVHLLSLEVHKQLNRIPEARLELLDGSVAERKFALSNAAFFAPSKEVEILLRYEGQVDVRVFKGIVVRHGVESRDEQTRLRVELKDAAVRLTRVRNSAVFRMDTDGGVIRRLITRAGLTAGTIADGELQHEELVQYRVSDWDFILSRADALGLVVNVDDGLVSVDRMDRAAATAIPVAFGLSDVSELELELDESRHYADVETYGWSVEQQCRSGRSGPEQQTAAASETTAGARAADEDAAVSTLVHPVPLPRQELIAWGSSRIRRQELARLRGRIVVPGRADVKPHDHIDLSGVGDRFDGRQFVAGVRHTVNHDGWKTELELGLSPEFFCERPDIAEVPAGGLLPPVSGLQIGVVAEYALDLAHQHRIPVRLPAIDEPRPRQSGAPAKVVGDFVWARVALPDAGGACGHAFWPRPGDEVVVGFFNGDPRQAVVLGGMYSSAHPPPALVGGPGPQNARRAIVSRAGSVVGFDDEKRSVFIVTPQGNTLVIDDTAAAISLADEHGNSIVLGREGVRIVSAGNLSIEAARNIEVKSAGLAVTSGGSTSIKAAGNVEITGALVDIK